MATDANPEDITYEENSLGYQNYHSPPEGYEDPRKLRDKKFYGCSCAHSLWSVGFAVQIMLLTAVLVFLVVEYCEDDQKERWERFEGKLEKKFRKLTENVTKSDKKVGENFIDIEDTLLSMSDRDDEGFRNISSLMEKSINSGTSESLFNSKLDSISSKIESLTKQLSQRFFQTETWIPIQRRTLFNVNFDRNWTEYETGFGDYASGDFWLGLHAISFLTRTGNWTLRMEFDTWTNESHFTEYFGFSVGGSNTRYKLTAGEQTAGTFTEGNYADGNERGWALHDGAVFSTSDADNDLRVGENCAAQREGGWWYMSCDDVNFNSKLASSAAQKWYYMKYYIPGQHQVNLKNSLMMIKLEY